MMKMLTIDADSAEAREAVAEDEQAEDDDAPDEWADIPLNERIEWCAAAPCVQHLLTQTSSSSSSSSSSI